MDLSKMDTVSGAERGGTLTIKDPTGALTDIEITVKGTDSDTYRRWENRLRKRDGVSSSKELFDLSAAEDRMTEVMAACTVDWKNLKEGSKAVECNHANAVRIYRSYPWVREQVLDFMRDRENFLGNSAPAS